MSVPRRFSAAVLGFGGVLVLTTAGVWTDGGTPPARAATTAASCALLEAEITLDAQVHEGLSGQFAAYGDSGDGWTGGDSTYSVALEDGRTVWIFSDTFLGPVADDGTRPEETPFLNNSFIVDDAGSFQTMHGLDEQGDPTGLVPPPTDEPEGWYWVGDGMQDRDGNIQLVGLRFWYGGGGMWDFGWEGNHLATFDDDTFELLSLAELPSESGVQWASWIEPAGDLTYVYGVQDAGENKYMHVARVLAPDLDGPWEFWTGSGWSDEETDTEQVMAGVANEYSVAAFEDGYLLLTQDTTELFSANVQAFVSCDPTGPFELVGTAYQMPEVGAEGSYTNPNIFAYNAHEHPHLRTEGSTVFTYNVNSFESEELYDDVTIYRPRFVELAISLTPPEQTPPPTVDPTEAPDPSEEPAAGVEPTDDPAPSISQEQDAAAGGPEEIARTGTGSAAMAAAAAALMLGAALLRIRRSDPGPN